VLIAPNLESGNMIVKELTFIAHAEGGGLVLGASAPVVLTSRADDERVRLGSCAVAALYWHWKNVGTAFGMAAE
jgi:phosphotransacetylase